MFNLKWDEGYPDTTIYYNPCIVLHMLQLLLWGILYAVFQFVSFLDKDTLA